MFGLAYRMCPTIEPETTAWVAVLAFSSDHRGRMLLSKPGVGPASGWNQPTPQPSPATLESVICRALRLWSVRPWGASCSRDESRAGGPRYAAIRHIVNELLRTCSLGKAGRGRARPRLIDGNGYPRADRHTRTWDSSRSGANAPRSVRS